MNRSESIKELAAALAKAQGKIKGAVRDASNPFFSRADRVAAYATLASVIDACREPMAENLLCYVQATHISETGLTLETAILHSSGEWISSEYPVRPVKDDPQGIGSALTYARRYGLMAMVGIAPEDDDGNAASGMPALGTQAAADFVRDQKIKDAGFNEKHSQAKADWERRNIKDLADGEQVLTGILNEVSAEIPTKNKKGTYVKVDVGGYGFNVFDKGVFSTLKALAGKRVDLIVKKEGGYLNFVALNTDPKRDASELFNQATGEITDEDVPF